MITRIETIERKIDQPVDKWIGNCYRIAVLIYNAGLVPKKSRVRYGIWWGPIDPSCCFGGRPFAHHGWIELPDKRIYDATRWVFEAQQPYVWLGRDEDDYYDPAGQQLQAGLGLRLPCPDRQPRATVFKLNAKQRALFADYMPCVLKADPDHCQLMWLANIPACNFGDNAKAVYAALEALGLKTFIPLDSWRYVMEDDVLNATELARIQ